MVRYNPFQFRGQKKAPKPLKTLRRAQDCSRAAPEDYWSGAGAPSERPDAHEIVEVYDSNHLAAFDDQKRLDLVADQLERLRD
jgi:hypothetical protein